MTSDLHKWLNNPHGVGGDYDKHHGVGDGSDEDEGAYDYTHYDSADTTRRTVSLNNDENYDKEDQPSDTEASQSDEDDKESDEEDEDNYGTHYTDASMRKRQELGLSPKGKPFCFLCAGEHLDPQCTTYPDERVRSRQCSCGLFHTEGICNVLSSDSDD